MLHYATTIPTMNFKYVVALLISGHVIANNEFVIPGTYIDKDFQDITPSDYKMFELPDAKEMEELAEASKKIIKKLIKKIDELDPAKGDVTADESVQQAHVPATQENVQKKSTIPAETYTERQHIHVPDANGKEQATFTEEEEEDDDSIDAFMVIGGTLGVVGLLASMAGVAKYYKTKSKYSF
ncbi:hypothetical protein O9G_004640 [Rozella allomycis CSF55]|uniref:Uncharacterized protein n=1 Tax=Rozella allomycis (strain CSF55) TaxID=988480 RepID=A0A075ARE3_ROZAC|nr:hypothetical protein O9G_004640 [Rozella allomycis CSF55]|eukprot:EPZ31067.1 hypothetical protein O9G_004640 [Rozella allomycis CSF55]